MMKRSDLDSFWVSEDPFSESEPVLYIKGFKIDEKDAENEVCANCFFCNEAPLSIHDLFDSKIERICCSSCFKIAGAFYRDHEYEGVSAEQARKYVLDTRDEIEIEKAFINRGRKCMKDNDIEEAHAALLRNEEYINYLANLRAKALELAIKFLSQGGLSCFDGHIILDSAKHFYDFLLGKSEHFKEDKLCTIDKPTPLSSN
jgi:hypothetical protein